MITRWVLALLALAAFPAPALAAITTLNTTVETETLAAASAQSQTVSFTVSAGSNRILIVRIGYQSGNAADMVTSVTYGGVAMTRAGQEISSSTATRAVEIWYLIAPTAGTANVVIDLNGTQTFGYLLSAITAYAGVDQTTPYGVFSTSDTTPASTTPTMNADSNADDWVIDVVSFYINATYTVTPNEVGQTEDAKEANNAGSISVGMSRRIATGSTTTMSWLISTATTGVVIHSAINLRETGTSGGTQSTRLLMGCCAP